jgi:hypothetical protein
MQTEYIEMTNRASRNGQAGKLHALEAFCGEQCPRLRMAASSDIYDDIVLFNL